jgi:hypothetical protein
MLKAETLKTEMLKELKELKGTLGFRIGGLAATICSRPAGHLNAGRGENSESRPGLTTLACHSTST